MNIGSYVYFDCNGYESFGKILDIYEEINGRKIYLIEDNLDGYQLEILDSYIKEDK